MTDATKSVIVEAVGQIEWRVSEPGTKPSLNESEPVARVRDDEGHRYIVTSRQCFRNGTTISPDIVGLKGGIEAYRGAAISFNCPTMFGKRGL